ncbi:hypothetical protein [Caminibacter mediatlanticus]|uniref:Uncharacterized protein n=1 Tax=Caminibacter mediatlanticus TB-2 TaxID=391592 RepID=A0AAI9AIZ3_9BACT|nr:hypothetical protein [Caminibacter mediatlanticus]EDM24339.1 hypothetical protein CMTB2_02448 [Caminibacter mediatlanticus TB-2]
MKLGNYYSTLIINNKDNVCNSINNSLKVIYLDKKSCEIKNVRVKFNLSTNYYLESNKTKKLIIIPRKYIISEIIK